MDSVLTPLLAPSWADRKVACNLSTSLSEAAPPTAGWFVYANKSEYNQPKEKVILHANKTEHGVLWASF